MDARQYDLVVVESDPADQIGAIKATKLGKRVAALNGLSKL